MTVKGTRLLFGDDAENYTNILDDLRKFAKQAGFQEIIVSSLASQQTFVDKAGSEILNQMFTFKDKGDRDICLIPEVTAVVQQWYKENYKALKKPTKVFYINRCYRYEKPQAGRYREFTQFGAEILGDTSGKDTQEIKDFLKYCMEQFKVDCTFNDSVRRGLSYYVEDGFEVECANLGAQKQVAGGGRYDCGIGFGIGVERLLLALDNQYAAYR
jgi:histidyl-tRNA synthetase